MESSSYDSRLFLALQALENDSKLKVTTAARLYNVPRTTLVDRRNGVRVQSDSNSDKRNLTKLEEEAIIKRVLELDAQGFPVRMSSVDDMANRLLHKRGAPPVGKHWTRRFIQRQPELKTQMSRSYDNQRALCEDPVKIQDWFRLVENVITKYGVRTEDVYNFDETGFLMGIIGRTLVVTSSERRSNTKLIQPGNREWVTCIQGVNAQGWATPPFLVFKGKFHLSSWYEDGRIPYDWRIAVSPNGWTTNEVTLEWLKHFDKFTRMKKVGGYRLLVLDGHESHHSDAFEEYCRTNNILTLCMPAHSSHLLQPLDVGCFGPLKKAYGRQIEDLVRARITHISKEDFLPAFQRAFQLAMTESNVQAGFRGSGLVPYDPETVISKLDVRLSTPTPENSRPSTSHSWVSKTPNTAREASLHTTLIKDRIVRHQDSSPTSIIAAVDLFAKGTSQVMHQMALLQAEVHDLRQANNELSRRRRTKKRRLQEGGTLGQEDLEDRHALDEVTRQIQGEEAESRRKRSRRDSCERRCRGCGETGHNIRTCQVNRATSNE